MPVPNVSEAGFVKCPTGQHKFEVEFHEEKEDKHGRMQAIFILKPIDGANGNVFHRFPSDPDDEYAWTLKNFLELLDMPTTGGYPWEELNGKRIVAWVEHKGRYVNIRSDTFEKYSDETQPMSHTQQQTGNEPF